MSPTEAPTRKQETSFQLDVPGLGKIPLCVVHRFDAGSVLQPLKPGKREIAATIEPNEIMDRWWQSVNTAQGTVKPTPESAYKRNATLRFFDAQGRETRSYLLHDVFPTKYAPADDTSTTSAIEWTFSVENVGSLKVTL